METSEKFALNTLDWKSIGKWALVALGGALLTYVESIILTVDFGQFWPIVMMANSIFVNAVRKFLAGDKPAV